MSTIRVPCSLGSSWNKDFLQLNGAIIKSLKTDKIAVIIEYGCESPDDEHSDGFVIAHSLDKHDVICPGNYAIGWIPSDEMDDWILLHNGHEMEV